MQPEPARPAEIASAAIAARFFDEFIDQSPLFIQRNATRERARELARPVTNPRQADPGPKAVRRRGALDRRCDPAPRALRDALESGDPRASSGAHRDARTEREGIWSARRARGVTPLCGERARTFCSIRARSCEQCAGRTFAGRRTSPIQ